MPPFTSKLPDNLRELERVINRHEQAAGPLKTKNEAKIIWADEKQKRKTSYSIVYLHGFTASRGEGEPLHKSIAQKFGCNLYLARLHGHGLKRADIFEDFTAQKLLRSAVDACRVGQKIGTNILVMGTSTGALLALHAAASDACSIHIKGLMLYSPLVHFYGARSFFLETAAGRCLATIVRGKDYNYKLSPLTTDEEKIWYPYFPLSAALTLGKIVQNISGPSLYERIQCPVFIGYYYRNRKKHDRIVSTRAIKRMAGQLGTPPSNRTLINFSNAGSHLIGSALLSQAISSVIEETTLFLQEKVAVNPLF